MLQAYRQSPNPFAADQPPVDEDAVAELTNADRPEGLPDSVWNNLLDYRTRKVAAEKDVRKAFANFSSLQSLVTAILENSERISSETEATAQSATAFAERRFQNMYNPLRLIQLKQGQVC